MALVPMEPYQLSSKALPWLMSRLLDERHSSLPHGGDLKFMEAVKKGMPQRNLRYVQVSEDERACLASSFPNKVIIGKDQILNNRKIWKFSLIGKFLGSKIPIAYLKEKVLHMWPLAGKVQILDLTEGYYYFKFEVFEDLMDIWKGCP